MRIIIMLGKVGTCYSTERITLGSLGLRSFHYGIAGWLFDKPSLVMLSNVISSIATFVLVIEWRAPRPQTPSRSAKAY